MSNSNSIAELMAAGREDQATGERIYILHRSQIVPDEGQDRDDWDDPATIANVESIRRASRIKLNDGKYYGIRAPLWVTPADEQGKHKIIDGECRWRSTEDGPDELQYLPCIIRTGDKKELRLDHTAANGARKQLTLFQVANSIKRDKEEFGLSTDEIMAVHGLTNKTQLSKYNQIHKLNDRAKELVRGGHFQDVNLVYELARLDDEALNKLEKKVAKGESFQQALKAVAPKPPKDPKDPKEPKDNGKEGAAPEGGVSDSETSTIILPLSLECAKAVASFFDVSPDLDPKDLQAALLEKLAALVPGDSQ